jgi:hypothetical protein
MAFNVPTSGFRGIPSSGGRGRLRMDSLRADESVTLDQNDDPIPWVHWNKFYPEFTQQFNLGDHVLLLGRTGSGKTYLMVRAITPLRRYVVVLGTKPKDDSLYRPLEKLGFQQVSTWDPDFEERPRIILKPLLSAPTVEAAKDHQQEVFNEALLDLFEMGNVCIVCDEIRYFTEFLRLRAVIELLYLQGRSNGVSMVAGTQRPVSIPLVAFEMATHQFVWRLTGLEDAKRASEFLGQNARRARMTIPKLPKYEFLYNNATTDYIARSQAPQKGR